MDKFVLFIPILRIIQRTEGVTPDIPNRKKESARPMEKI